MRDIPRTPEALHDMRPRAELTGEEIAREYRACVIFAICAIAVVYGLLSIGGM